MLNLRDRYRGLVLGTAVGDSIGLPAEGISRARAGKMFNGRWRHRFIFGHGMLSDDTEHMFFVIQCLLAHPDSAEQFADRLGLCLKWWFAALPAGVGMATSRACIKMWLSVSTRNGGVLSAGNGPAMRVAPIGAFFYSAQKDQDAYVKASTCVTHTDPKALIGAIAIARTAAWIVRDDLVNRPPLEAFSKMLEEVSPENSEWIGLVKTMEESLSKDATVEEFACSIGLENGVTGYIYHTVPIVLYAWHRHFGDYEKTLSSVLNCGGDTDTTGAIAGALAGLTVGENGIPKDWIDGIADWPRSVHLLRLAADRLSELKGEGASRKQLKYCWPAVVPRNVLVLIIVLGHGFRRLLPPY
ncbi:MAG: ADP-ribosylglycohydrolase family protein [Victivallales bacterium]